MTEQEIIDYFKNHYYYSRDYVGRSERINISVPKVDDEEVQKFLFSSAKTLVSICNLLEIKYPESHRRDWSGPNIFKCDLYITIPESSDSTIQFNTIYGPLSYYIKDIVNPKRYLRREIKNIRKELSAKVDEKLESLGKAVSIQEETEAKIKEWGLE